MYEIKDAGKGDVVWVEVSGKLTHEDYKTLVPELEKKIEESGQIRVLFDLEKSEGWDLHAAWDDFKFWFKHSMDVTQIALVGNKKWQEWAARLSSHFVKAEVKFYDVSEKETASQWLG